LAPKDESTPDDRQTNTYFGSRGGKEENEAPFFFEQQIDEDLLMPSLSTGTYLSFVCC
jgi:hypothetical protein